MLQCSACTNVMWSNWNEWALNRKIIDFLAFLFASWYLTPQMVNQQLNVHVCLLEILYKQGWHYFLSNFTHDACAVIVSSTRVQVLKISDLSPKWIQTKGYRIVCINMASLNKALGLLRVRVSNPARLLTHKSVLLRGQQTAARMYGLDIAVGSMRKLALAVICGHIK